jgi:hypothetical protein
MAFLTRMIRFRHVSFCKTRADGTQLHFDTKRAISPGRVFHGRAELGGISPRPGGIVPSRSAKFQEIAAILGIFGMASGMHLGSTSSRSESRAGCDVVHDFLPRNGDTMMIKFVAIASSVLVSLGLAAILPAEMQPPDGPSPKSKVKAKGKVEPKKKGEREPGAELTKAYDLLRRLRADENSGGRPEERLRDWTDRAAGLYRAGLKALNGSEGRVAREYGAAAHDLARAVDHARNAVRYDRPDPDLPPPSDKFGPEDTRERARRDLYHAYERLGWLADSRVAAGSEFYIKAARDLYGAARRDLEAGREERGGELARAAEAMTHVPEHLAQVGEEPGRFTYRPDRPVPPDVPEPKKEREPSPRERRTADLPPALPPG